MQNEILLLLNTSFAQAHIKKLKEESKKFACKESSEEDYINSLLQQVLPMFFYSNAQYKIHLWQIHSGVSSLQFEPYELPSYIDVRHSIEPHNFLATKCYN